jgi:hypothetical protein
MYLEDESFRSSGVEVLRLRLFAVLFISILQDTVFLGLRKIMLIDFIIILGYY